MGPKINDLNPILSKNTRPVAASNPSDLSCYQWFLPDECFLSRLVDEYQYLQFERSFCLFYFRYASSMGWDIAAKLIIGFYNNDITWMSRRLNSQTAWRLAQHLIQTRNKYNNKTSRHYSDVIMRAMASQITSLTIDYSTNNSNADQTKHQGSASLAFVKEIRQWPVTSPYKGPVTRNICPFHEVIIVTDRL